ncbi:unnamed protein product [Durusdinium trenchii]|uniref:SAM domain-containing protein n=2 Tax=Durusdinium trenchii TaxID=1381693 RepID=A0ABP0S8B5_9DINO
MIYMRIDTKNAQRRSHGVFPGWKLASHFAVFKILNTTIRCTKFSSCTSNCQIQPFRPTRPSCFVSSLPAPDLSSMAKSRCAQRVLVAIVVLFRWQVDFVESPFPLRPSHRLKHALFWGKKKSQEPPKACQDIYDMDTRAVCSWLRALGPKFEQYVPRFEDEDVDGLLLSTLTDDNLQNLDVDQEIHRKKILVHRDALVKHGYDITGQRQELPLDRLRERVNVARPRVEHQQLTDHIFDSMRKEGISLGVSEQAFITSMDDLLSELLEEGVYMEALDTINHYVWSWTASVEQAGIREDVQADLEQIAAGKDAHRQRIVATQQNIKLLAMSLDRYCRSTKKDRLTDKEKDQARLEMEENLQTWLQNMQELAGKASFSRGGLLERASARLRMQLKEVQLCKPT